MSTRNGVSPWSFWSIPEENRTFNRCMDYLRQRQPLDTLYSISCYVPTHLKEKCEMQSRLEGLI